MFQIFISALKSRKNHYFTVEISRSAYYACKAGKRYQPSQAERQEMARVEAFQQAYNVTQSPAKKDPYKIKDPSTRQPVNQQSGPLREQFE